MAQSYTSKMVVDHFQDAGEYRHRKGLVHAEDHEILNFIKKVKKNGLKVLEVGGGSGYILDHIAREESTATLCNCEIAAGAYKDQVNGNISLIESTALHLPFKSDTFDVVIIKNLLHHIVGSTRRQSRENARKAVQELIRVTKTGGHVIVVEIYNDYRLFADLLFYITVVFSRLGLTIRALDLDKYVIISFLTSREILGFLAGEGAATTETILSKSMRINQSWKFKVTLLMANTGRVFAISKVHKR